MLMDLLNKATTAAMLSFVVSSMLAMGAGLTIRQIIEPLGNARLVAFALLANFVLMPLGAFALAKLLRLQEPFGIGLLLLGCAAGAPFLPKLAELAKGNLLCHTPLRRLVVGPQHGAYFSHRGEAIFHRCGVALRFPRVTPRPVDAQATLARRVSAGDVVLVIGTRWRQHAHARSLSFPNSPTEVWRASSSVARYRSALMPGRKK